MGLWVSESVGTSGFSTRALCAIFLKFGVRMARLCEAQSTDPSVIERDQAHLLIHDDPFFRAALAAEMIESAAARTTRGKCT